MTLTIEEARQVLDGQPFNSLVGGRITSFRQGAATLEIPIRDELRQQFGLVHGGVLAYAADNVLTFAAGSVLGPNVLTAGFTITYLRPAAGKTLRAEAEVISATRRQALCHCEIYSDDDGREPILVAAAQGTTKLLEKVA